MRGKEVLRTEGLQYPGITPAYAGKRPLPKLRANTARDHPRVCGEKYNIRKSAKYLLGITPAYAGKSNRWGAISR